MPDILEVGRRLKLSFNGYITYRKLAGILLLLLFFFLYLGLGIMAWLTDYVMGTLTQVQCVAEGSGCPVTSNVLAYRTVPRVLVQVMAHFQLKY